MIPGKYFRRAFFYSFLIRIILLHENAEIGYKTNHCAWGRTYKQRYKFLAPIVGFEYKHYEYKTIEQAIKKAKVEIDAGCPTVLGALDMYYLPYYSKLYHRNIFPFTTF